MDDAIVSANCVTEQIERAANLMAAVVLTPSFDAKEFEKLRKQELTDLRISSAEPFYLADRKCGVAFMVNILIREQLKER